MNLFGFSITRARPAPAPAGGASRELVGREKSLAPVDNRGGWWPIVRESYAGAWQQNVEVSVEDALQYWAVFRCISIIAGDIAKMRIKLVEQRKLGGIWSEIELPDYSDVLRKPNGYQTAIQFRCNWIVSKLSRGNTYVLKRRDPRTKRVKSLYILNPDRVAPMVVLETGEVLYQLQADDLAGVDSSVYVPASEIIHDRWNCLYHPLVGLSPLYAAGINALAGLRIEQNTARLFANGARPGGILTAPAHIPVETATRVKEYWDSNYSGANAGKVAVLGDGLTYESLAMTAVEAELVNQLKWNDSVIAGVYGVPAYMINAAGAPPYNNVEALNQQYYSQALQVHVEDMELLLDEGLELPQQGTRKVGTEFDLDGLLRMDTPTLIKTLGEAVARGIYKPNEARAKLDKAPVEGGDEVYLQQQNYSLSALAKRDAKDDPFATGGKAADTAPDPDNDNEDAGDGEEQDDEAGTGEEPAAKFVNDPPHKAIELRPAR